MTNKETPAERSVDRRKLLRRAGTVAVGVAGAGVVSAVAASPANAADGGPVTLGAANSATKTTGITSSGTTATLALANGSTDSTSGLAGAPLNLAPRTELVNDDAPGNIGMTDDGLVWVTSTYADGLNYQDFFYTTGNANITVPINPVRAIDTRYSANRARILNAAGNIDSSGRVIGGHTINVDLSDLVFYGWAAFGNLTVVSPTAAGFVTLYPYGTTRPATSSINTQTATLSNAYVCGLGFDNTNQNLTSVISIYVQRTAAIILDVNAFVVSYGGAVNTAFTAAPMGTATVTRTPTREQMMKKSTPSWQK